MDTCAYAMKDLLGRTVKVRATGFNYENKIKNY